MIRVKVFDESHEKDLEDAVNVFLKKIDDIGICELTSQDVVRHPLVQKIVHAYDEYEQKTIKKSAIKKEYKEDVKRSFEPAKKPAVAGKTSGETANKPVEFTRKTVTAEKKSGNSGKASMKKKGERLFRRK